MFPVRKDRIMDLLSFLTYCTDTFTILEKARNQNRFSGISAILFISIIYVFMNKLALGVALTLQSVYVTENKNFYLRVFGCKLFNI